MKNFSIGGENYSRKLPSEDSEETKEEPSFEDQEQEVNRESIEIKTVADFIRALELAYDVTEDIEEKQKIGHQIVKINISLNLTDYTADKVKVEETPDGVLGLYYPGSGKTAISEELLEDFSVGSSLITHTLAHEERHKKGTADEGVVELELKRKLPVTISFYVSEQQKAKRAFYNIGTEKALNIYNMDKPKELVDSYLKVEIDKKYKFKKTELKDLQRESYLKIRANKETDSLSKKLKEGVPRFYDRIEQGYIKKKVKEGLENLVNNI